MTRLIASLALLFLSISGHEGQAPAHERQARAQARIVAIADIHGDIDAFKGILKAAHLIDDAGRWAGGKATLVQTGDVFDRGAKVRAVLDLLMTLEQEAKAAGGRVEPLFGNHEGMNLIGFLRDVNPAVYTSFADTRSERRRNDAYEAYARLAAARTKALGQTDSPYALDREAWLAAHPLGYVEYREALGRDGRYGRWLRARNPAVQIGETVFLHGGISDRVAPQSIKEINERVRNELRAFDDALREMVLAQLALPFFTLSELQQAAVLQWKALNAPEGLAEHQRRQAAALRELIQVERSWFLDPDGPLWFRGYANWTSDEGPAKIGPILDTYKARRVVVGHTPTAGGRITARFDNRVFLIDTGMLSTYYKGGRASALEIVGDRVTAIYADERVILSTEITEDTENTEPFGFLDQRIRDLSDLCDLSVVNVR